MWGRPGAVDKGEIMIAAHAVIDNLKEHGKIRTEWCSHC